MGEFCLSPLSLVRRGSGPALLVVISVVCTWICTITGQGGEACQSACLMLRDKLAYSDAMRAGVLAVVVAVKKSVFREPSHGCNCAAAIEDLRLMIEAAQMPAGVGSACSSATILKVPSPSKGHFSFAHTQLQAPIGALPLAAVEHYQPMQTGASAPSAVLSPHQASLVEVHRSRTCTRHILLKDSFYPSAIAFDLLFILLLSSSSSSSSSRLLSPPPLSR